MGSRGFITSSHYFAKQAEFRCWLSEVRGIPPDAPVPKPELLSYFKDYAEDYNTATLPSEKYYDLEKWERGVGRAKAAAAAAAGVKSSGAMDMLAMEASAKRSSEASRAAFEAERMALYRASLGPQRLAEMKQQAELQQAMQYAFRAGNTKEAERIKKLLEPEKQKVTW